MEKREEIEITWENLIDIIDNTFNNNSIKCDLLYDKIRIEDCISSKLSYKRNFNELSNINNSIDQLENSNVNINKKLKFS
jgi:hypothetical protein